MGKEQTLSSAWLKVYLCSKPVPGPAQFEMLRPDCRLLADRAGRGRGRRCWGGDCRGHNLLLEHGALKGSLGPLGSLGAQLLLAGPLLHLGRHYGRTQTGELRGGVV